MASLREIVQQRAKVPAKIHAMEAGPGRASSEPASGGAMGSPLIVQYAAQQAGGEAPSSDKRPPRPPTGPVAVNSGDSSAAAPLKKSSEDRKPRSGSVPRRRVPSEPPRDRNVSVERSEAGSDGRPPAPRAKARASSVRARISDEAPPVDRKDVGKVPAYLRRRQEEMAEEKRRAARPPSPQAPPGYRKVPDSEKQATLDVLKQRKSEVEKAQRNLPFKIETAGQKQREKDLTDRLAHIDKLLSMFSQPVVCIPADAEPIANSVPPLPQGMAGRPVREREEGPAIVEDGHANQACREPRARSGSTGQEVGGYVPNFPPTDGRASTPGASVRTSSRENRNKASAERRALALDQAPWATDRNGPGPSDVKNARTAVQVVAPPGGKSSLSLNWD